MRLHGTTPQKTRHYGFHSTLGHLKAQASPQIQAQAATGVIKRLIPDKAELFQVTVDPRLGPVGKDTFKVLKENGQDRVNLVGTSGVAAVWGFHHYLKYYCFCHVSWDSDQLSLPEKLPPVNITVTSVDRFRYYQNVCTTSYSFVWWGWPRWEREIDWMALNGINLALAFTGQEAIWQRVYLKLNLTQTDISRHLSGPAFLAWLRMGNMRGFGGPLPNSWHSQSLALQHRILARMRELGIVPVLPAFAGHVAQAFKRVYPNTSLTLMADWNHFSDEYCCPYLLEPTDPMFKTVGNMFISELVAEFGTNHVYSCDTFNEMTPHTSNVTYLSAVSSAVFSAMTDVDPSAVWLKQNWVFVHDVIFWTTDKVKAFISAVPIGRMIILDLQSELYPQYKRLHSYYGQPFIWCMLHNFGGTLGLYGSVENINMGVFDGRSLENGTMIGTGLTPEGINQNYVVYDLMNEMAWRAEPANLTEWFSAYVRRRYGTVDDHVNKAWQLLKSGVYNFTGLRKVRGKYVICRRPSLELRQWVWYNTTELAVAWDELLSASSQFHSAANYRHDLVDVTRQALQVLGGDLHNIIVSAFRKGNLTNFRQNTQLFQNLLNDLDVLLGSNEDFLLGHWLEAAKALGTTASEKQLYEYNARNQITLWGPHGEIVDYANKQWAGVVSHYFLPRWSLFLSALNNSLATGIPFNQSHTAEQIFKEVEEPFTLDTTVFPTSPQGDSIAIATDIHARWRSHFVARRPLRRFRHYRGRATLGIFPPRSRVFSLNTEVA
ncbi:alpha-N-acetylglucosaminidase isoform X2 [Zootermopsis nevadensis]|uniref:alpha-N-acetylglucosaminidase isoform X2 n=1 Tax=Zootermopsis nevadensis TaxID=136037 RepID=UPI000B8E640A|nr:alpha-N-acetylglucosaminidase isoform X2 [Zootermopsis nevadensis]